MIIFNNFRTLDGQSYRFRRKHPAQTFAGCPGIYAFTTIDDFELRALRFYPANDLIDADEPRVFASPEQTDFRGYGEIGIAVLPMRNSTSTQREHIAQALNAAISRPRQAA